MTTETGWRRFFKAIFTNKYVKMYGRGLNAASDYGVSDQTMVAAGVLSGRSYSISGASPSDLANLKAGYDDPYFAAGVNIGSSWEPSTDPYPGLMYGPDGNWEPNRPRR